jgi:hypothetical protein
MSRRRAIDLPSDLVSDLATIPRGDVDVIGLDPGSKASGLALLRGPSVIFSTQGKPVEVVRAFRAFHDGARVAVLVREKPYMRVRENEDGTVNHGREITQMESIWKLGFAAGAVTIGLGRCIDSAVLWEPLPSSALAVLGLNRKKTADRSARDETAEAVWLWAQATTGMDLVSKNGARLNDEARAIALAHAGRSIIESVKQMEG